jgi:hypothetical protein
VCANAIAFSHRTFNERRYFYHPAAADLHFDTAPRYWKSKVVWRWAFSLPLIRKHGLRHAGFKLGQDVCFMYAALLRSERFCQVKPCAYYFRQEHKSAYPSLAVQIEHGFAHFAEVKRILLRDTPDGAPRIKPFIKYLNENYWRDINKVAPRLAGGDAVWEGKLIALGLELFDGLDPDWFRARFLGPEVREATAFLPFAEAMIAGDTAAARGVIHALRAAAVPAPDKKNRSHTLRHKVKALFTPHAYAARLRLARLESRAAGRKSVPRPAPAHGAHPAR